VVTFSYEPAIVYISLVLMVVGLLIAIAYQFVPQLTKFANTKLESFRRNQDGREEVADKHVADESVGVQPENRDDDLGERREPRKYDGFSGG
jgi:hypothetical protein